MITFYMIDHEGFVLENISTLKTDMFPLVEDDMVKSAFTVILTILAGKIPARYKFLIMSFFAVTAIRKRGGAHQTSNHLPKHHI